MTDPRGVHPAHLDAATIAAFVDRTLDPAARAEAEAHLAACADCREVWVETSDLVKEEAGGVAVNTTDAPAPRSRSRRWIYGGAGMAVAAAIALAVFSPRLFDRGDRPELRELVEAVGTNRRTEARLTGGFAWGPVPSVARGNDTEPPWDVRLALAHLLTDGATAESARAIAATGTGYLIAGDIDEAISALESASRIDPNDAEIWSDLAGAYLERARLVGDAAAAKESLQSSDRALAIEAELPEGRFNRALALEYLGDIERAIEAWSRFLEVDSTSQWANEARRRSDRARPSRE